MAIRTRLIERLGIQHPILNAPMGGVAVGRLAAEVPQPARWALIGAGFGGDIARLEEQFATAGNAQVGC